jgi:hypothetical protein
MTGLWAILDVRRGFRFLRSFLTYERQCGSSSARLAVKHLYEIVILHLVNKLACEEYYFWDFHTDRFSWDEKKSFITRRQLETVPGLVNDPAYSILTDDKLVFKRYFANAGLPVPELIGVFDPCAGFIEGGGRLRTKDDLKEWIRETECDHPVFKPVRGLQGLGTLVFEKRDPVHRDLLRHVNGEPYDADRLYHHLTHVEVSRSPSYLIERRIQQHPALSIFNPSTAHTVRIMTLGHADGEVEIMGAVLRLGVGDQGVDNMHAGGICVAIHDLERGRLGHGMLEVDKEMRYATTHPDSNIEFVGHEIPFWRETRALAIQAARHLPCTPWVGWDIGVGADGPILLEGNEIWGGVGVQKVSGRGLWTPRIRERVCAGRDSG